MNYWKSSIVFGIIFSICAFTVFYNNTSSFPNNGEDLYPSGVYDISGSVIYIDYTSEDVINEVSEPLLIISLI